MTAMKNLFAYFCSELSQGFRIIISLCLFFFIFNIGDLFGTIRYVDSDATSGDDNGFSWANAYLDLQDALSVAVSGDEIWVAAGTYYPSQGWNVQNGTTSTTAREESFRIPSGVKVYGGFAGTESAVSERASFGEGEANETILSGDINQDDPTVSDNAYHVVYFYQANSSTEINGFTITAAKCNGGDPNDNGGAIYNRDNSSPIIKYCVIKENDAYRAAGIYNYDNSSPEITKCIIKGNDANFYAGIYNSSYCSPDITNCLISGNYSSYGSGIMNDNWCSPNVTNTTIAGNRAQFNGGGVQNSWNCSPVFTNCIIWGNSAGSAGNCVHNSNSSPTFNYCDIQGGQAVFGDGGGNSITYTNNIDQNPFFVDPVDPADAPTTDGDLRILNWSPCVDAGTSTGAPSDDIEGDSRIGNPDIGAYESGVSRGTIYVDADASGANDGSSWTDALTNLNSALGIAADGDEIWVAAGTYYPSQGWNVANGTASTDSREESFRIPSGVKVYGGFAGTETAISQRANYGTGEANETILSGDLNQDDDSGGDNSENAFHVVFLYEDDSDTRLDGFSIKDGSATGSNGYEKLGGGIYIYRGDTPVIENCNISGNSASDYGGGMYVIYCTPTITNSYFADNGAKNGGALSIFGNPGTFTNCVFSGNAAVEKGGALRICENNSNVVNCTFSGNRAADGGGLIIDNCSPTIKNSVIWNNSASVSGNQVYNTSSSPIFSYCDIQGGRAAFGDDGGNSITYTDNIDQNPFFVDPVDPADAPTTSGDFRLYNGSPCLNSGDNSANSETYDIAGNARIQGGTIDMGSYEGGVARGIIYVDADASGANSGFSWTNAYEDIQDALEASTSGDEIWVAAGTYKPETEVGGTGDRYKTFQMKDGVAIYGGFEGNEDTATFDLDDRDFEANETILSGDIGNIGDNSDNCYHVFYHPSGLNLTGSAVLDGFTITGGKADGVSPHSNGGGMYNYSSSPSLTNCTISNNSASLEGGGSSDGGGLYNYSSSPSLINCKISNNSAVDGGGIFNLASSPELTNCTISYNSASFRGGGIFNDGSSSPTIKNSIIWGNSASISGNQMYIFDGTTTLDYSCYSNENNDVFNNGTFTATNNNITENPKFVDPANNDFTLYGSSPCVNTGNNAYVAAPNVVVLKDMRGEDRIQNKTIDMGAYEWTSGTDPTIPTVTTQAVSSIGTTSATGNGNITATGGENCSERGIIYYPYTNTDKIIGGANVTKVDETGDFGTGSFTRNLTALTAETRYNARAYGHNSAGNSYGSTIDFRTYSSEPPATTGLDQYAATASSVSMSWTAPAWPLSGATAKGYVLIRATSPNIPVFAASDGLAPAAGANTTLVSSTIAEGATTYTDNGLSGNTTYNYMLIPYTWNNSDSETYNYQTSGAETAQGVTIYPEPSYHVSNFNSEFVNYKNFNLTWTDATGGTLPHGYLIRGSTVSLADITDPADRTPITTNGLNFNVAQGIQSQQLINLTVGQTYYFKIFPYTNSGSNIDYKTDGTVPSLIITPEKRGELWVSENYCSSCGNDGHTWLVDCFDNLTDALAVINNGGTIHTNGVTTSENLNLNNYNITIGDEDLVLIGTINGSGIISTRGEGMLKFQGHASPCFFPVGVKGNPFFIQISWSGGTQQTLAARVFATLPLTLEKAITESLWELSGPDGLNATIKFYLPKTQVQSVPNENFMLRWDDPEVEWDQYKFSVDADTSPEYYIITITGVNSF